MDGGISALSVSTAALGQTPSSAGHPSHAAFGSTRVGLSKDADVTAEAGELREIFLSSLKLVEWARNSLDTFRHHLLSLAFPLILHSALEICCFDDAAAQACDTRGFEGLVPLLVPAARKLVEKSEGAAEEEENTAFTAPHFANALAAARLLIETVADDFRPGHAAEIAALGLIRAFRVNFSDGGSVTPRPDRRQQLFSYFADNTKSFVEGSLSFQVNAAFGGGAGSREVPPIDLNLLGRLLDPSVKYKTTAPIWAFKLLLDYLMRRNSSFLLRTLNECVQVELREVPASEYLSQTAREGFFPPKITAAMSGVGRTAELLLTFARRGGVPPAPGASLQETVANVVRWGVPAFCRHTPEGLIPAAYTGNIAFKAIPWPDYASSALGRCIASSWYQPDAAAAKEGGGGAPVSGVKRRRQEELLHSTSWKDDTVNTLHIGAPKGATAAAMRVVHPAVWNGGLRQVVAGGLSDGSVRVWATVQLSQLMAAEASHSNNASIATSTGAATASATVTTTPAGTTAAAGDDYERTFTFLSSPSLRQHGRVTSMDIAPDGNFVLCGTCKGQVILYSLQSQLQSCVKAALAELKGGAAPGKLERDYGLSFVLEPLAVYRHHLSLAVWSVAFCPLTPKVFVSGGRDGTAKLWSTSEELPQMIFAGHASDVACIAIHPNGMYTLTGCDDNVIRVWDNVSGECVRLLAGHRARITSLACALSGRFVASGDGNGMIRLWDITTGATIIELRGHAASAAVTSVLFHNCGYRLASADARGRICFWDATETLSKFTGPTYSTLHSSDMKGVTELRTGLPRCLTTDSSDCLVCVTV